MTQGKEWLINSILSLIPSTQTHTCLTVLCDLDLLSLWHLGNVKLTLWDLMGIEKRKGISEA